LKEFWDDLWERERDFLQSGKRDLRHGVSSVGVSTIAGQYYCELKVENEFLHGEIPTEEKEEGTVLHDELIQVSDWLWFALKPRNSRTSRRRDG
jgi:hypothetical protein